MSEDELKEIDQLLLSNAFQCSSGSIETFCHRNYTYRLDIVQNSSCLILGHYFCEIFIYIYIYIYILGILEQCLVQKIIHEDLI